MRLLFIERPDLLTKAVKIGFALKRAGLSGLVAKTGLLRLLGLGAVQEAEAHVQEAPERTLAEALREDPSLRDGPGAQWRYFASCGTNFVFPRVGRASLRILRRLYGEGAFFDNPCCGLMAYNYGDIETARELARMNIERWESARGDAPLFADCSSCAAHLKSYPQLFLNDPGWRARAERFAASVKDIVETAPPVRAGALPGLVTLHDSCRAKHGQCLSKEPRAAVKAAAAAFKEMEESDACCGGAGLFAFKHPELSEELLRRKIQSIAATGAATVCASGTSCLIQLARGLKKYYPEGRVVHWSEAVCEALDGRDG
jgi:glycolate oxidase iron-sulfur subunit